MKFTKMQAAGNDYVYVNGFQEKVDHPEEVARFVSDRHFGIGSDGLILINPSEVADFEMAMYNADGSRGEMCGNGIRSVAKYVYDKGMTDKTQITVETLAGVKTLDLFVIDGKVTKVRVNMGEPILEAGKIPVLMEPGHESDRVISSPIEVDGDLYHMTCVSMGNPHCVIFCEFCEGEGIDKLDIEKVGPHFEHHPRFPNRINTEFVNVIDRNTLRMRVWERGSGETLACGTGACAVAVAAVLNNLAERSVTVELLGGNLEIEWDEQSNQVFMTGSAKTVFEGEIDDVYNQ
jgi:diaminopimelate epimerase